MNTITSEMVKDQVIMKNLAALEQTGEEGFATYHSGDTQSGTQLMKASLHQSDVNIKAIHDPALQKQAKNLLNTANKAIAAYMRDPSEAKMDTLRQDVDNYKNFLSQNES